MKKEKSIKNRWLHLRLDEADYLALKKRFHGTTERNISTYARKILLGKPMIKGVRDQSLQEILAALYRLQKDLNGIGNNFNQMVRRLHQSDHDPAVRSWLSDYLNEREKILQATDALREYLQQTAKKWLR